MATNLATLGGGCFWCTEAVFQQVAGVIRVTSGYAGGVSPNPSYQAVCSGETGHAECVQIEFNPQVIRFAELLNFFFKTHDPTTLNRQGNDCGTQYRSVVFYHDDEQHRIAEQYVSELNAAGVFPRQIVTQIAPAPTFYPAEDYHQNYYANHRYQAYCQAVIVPKLAKFQKEFRAKLRSDTEA